MSEQVDILDGCHGSPRENKACIKGCCEFRKNGYSGAGGKQER